MSDEYVIAHTQATALIVASLIRSGELPRLYHDPIDAIKAFYDQPVPLQKRYHLFHCDLHGSATVMADPKKLIADTINSFPKPKPLSQSEVDEIVGLAQRLAPRQEQSS